MAIDSKSIETIGAGHGYGGMLLQVEEVYNDVKNRFGQTRFMGGFVDRNVRGGSNKSMHAYGRAFDIGGSTVVMQQIAEYLRKINGVQYVIYNRKISSKGGAWRTYNGENPHTDHVHADFLTSFKGLSRKVYTVKPGET